MPLVHPSPPLTDGVVVLRALRRSDLPAVVEAVQDPLVKRFVSSIPYPYGMEQAEAWFASQAVPADDLHFTVADAQDDTRLLGAVGLEVVPEHRRAETGYWVAPWARRQGVAVRALAPVCDWAFDTLDLARLELIADVENAGSQRVAARAGFVREGVLAQHTVMDDASRDCAIYARVRPS